MIATVPSASLLGADGEPVEVEVHVSSGIPGFTIVGLPDAACREARDRVRAALLSSGLNWPLRRVTVNLAPSSLRKVGAGLDLAIALGLLVATGEVAPESVDGCGFLGELGLDGSLRAIPGALALTAATRARVVVVPAACLGEALLVEGRRVLGARSLREAVEALRGEGEWAPRPPRPSSRPATGFVSPCAPGARQGEPASPVDLAEIRGQPLGRRAVEVAAAGGHHLLLVGPPGAGKTMLARSIPGLLPPLSPDQALEVRRVHSAAGVQLGEECSRPPFRAPHHSASPVALVGGGTVAMRPGEISLASSGVLFLDELGEFPTAVLENLRQPMEEGIIRVARARAVVTFPARFLLVAASNPCPCGEGGLDGRCRCSPYERARYGRRLSAPLLDRFDLQVFLDRPSPESLLGEPPDGEEPTATVAARVATARQQARRRGVACNADLAGGTLEEHAPLSAPARALLLERLRAGALSARALARVRLVALTLADLAGDEPPLAREHVSSAVELRAGRFALAVA